MLPAINVVNDALMTGDLSFGAAYYEWLIKWHLYLHVHCSCSTGPASVLLVVWVVCCIPAILKAD